MFTSMDVLVAGQEVSHLLQGSGITIASAGLLITLLRSAFQLAFGDVHVLFSFSG